MLPALDGHQQGRHGLSCERGVELAYAEAGDVVDLMARLGAACGLCWTTLRDVIIVCCFMAARQ